jgi:TolB-like protein
MKLHITKGPTVVAVLALTASLVSAVPLHSQDYQQQIDRLAEDIAATVTKFDLKSIAILDFTDLQGNTPELGRFLAQELTTSLVLKERSFRTIDRANLRSILQEQKLSMTGLVNRDETKKLKISGVDGLIRGTITPFGESIRLTLQVITVENANIVGAARGTVPKTSAMDSLGSNLDLSTNTSNDGVTSGTPPPRIGRNPVFQDKNLRVTLKYLRKSADDRIKAIFSIDNLRDTDLTLNWNDLQMVDDQGEQWRMLECTGLTTANTALTRKITLTALVVFYSGNGAGKATQFNIIGSIVVHDGTRDSISYISFPDTRLGI